MIKISDVTQPVIITNEAVSDEKLSCNTGIIKKILGNDDLPLVEIELTSGGKTVVGLHEVSN